MAAIVAEKQDAERPSRAFPRRAWERGEGDAVAACDIVTAPPAPRTGRAADRATIAVFLAALAIPLGGFLARKADAPLDEKRAPCPPPVVAAERWAVQAFPPMFEAYFNDRVGFRKEMLKARRAAVLDAFGDSTSDLVWVGREGWLFINCGGPFGGLPALQAPAEPNIDGWADVLADRHAWLAARGIPYVVLIAREKSTVYPEHLPGVFQRHPPPDDVPRLLEKLRGSGVVVVDARAALARAKAGGPVFLKADSHWNDAGAFAAYSVLGAELERRVPGYSAKPPAAFQPTPCWHPVGDLALALGLPKDKQGEPADFYAEIAGSPPDVPAADLQATLEASGGRLGHLPVRLTESPGTKPRGLLLHDSFGVDVRRLLASDFARLACAGTYSLPVRVVEQERPAVVVQLFAERVLRCVPPTNPPEVTSARRP